LVAPAAHLNAPSGEVRLARGLNAPSGEFCLAQGPLQARHPRSCSHIQAFNALAPQDSATTLTRLGITPRRCSTHSLGKTIPATIQHCAERPVSAPWHCAAYFRTANTSSPRRGLAEPSNGGECFFYDYTGLHLNVRPAGTVFSVAVSPARPSPPLQRHAGYCDDIPNAVGTHGDRTSHARHCTLYGPPLTAPSSRPTDGGRTPNLYVTTLEAAPVRAQVSPQLPNRSEIRQDGRQLRSTARHAFTRRRTVRHACKLLPPWPMKGGVVPQSGGTTDSNHPHAFRLHHDIGTCLNQKLWDLEARPPLPPRL
jgi:hypothetical protein